MRGVGVGTARPQGEAVYACSSHYYSSSSRVDVVTLDDDGGGGSAQTNFFLGVWYITFSLLGMVIVYIQ